MDWGANIHVDSAKNQCRPFLLILKGIEKKESHFTCLKE